MATQWISKQTTRRQAAPPTWCPLLQRQVPCTALEVWHVRPDGRTGERVTAPSGDPVMVPVGHHGEMCNYLYGRRGRFALVARDHLGRIAGRRDFEETDDFCWAGPKTTEQRLNEQIGELRSELRESRQRCADLEAEVQRHEMAARKAKNARFNAEMERKSQELLRQAEISLLNAKADRAELDRKASATKRRKGSLPDIDKAFDIAGHVLDRLDRITDRSAKSEGKQGPADSGDGKAGEDAQPSAGPTSAEGPGSGSG